MTNDKMVVREGDVEVVYTVVPTTPDRLEQIEAAAQALVQVLVDASAFSTSEFSENNARPVDY